MANLLSSAIIADNYVPDKYVAPPDKRPVSVGNLKVPVIDLSDKENTLKIMNAAKEFGIFEVVNHGISTDLLTKTLEIFEEVFKLSPEEKAKINKEEDVNGVCKIYPSSYNFGREDYHYWRDVLRHICTPLDDTIKYWPENPPNYREVIKPYVQALKDLSTRILENLCEGLGLPKGYLTETDLNKADILTINHYPPCPEPSLTIGLPTHTDPTLINLVHGTPLDVQGLQLFKDGQWFDLESTPGALFVFIGTQLEVISNGRLIAAPHRAVTNAEKPRTTSVYFVNPTMESVVEPAKVLLEAENERPLYKSFKYKEFFKAHTGYVGDRHEILEMFNFTIKY
ncbi:hypothetical protein vseg_001319 [Gypsophila vaccaria]